MKRVGLLVIFLITLYAQNRNKQVPSPDLGQIEKGWEVELKINPHDTIEGGIKNEYQRWKSFWSYRSFGTNNSVEVAPICPYSFDNNSNWKLLGPIENVLPIGTMGIVVSLAVNPIDSTIIYAGSRTGGLWRAKIDTSAPENTHWRCLTDNPRYPIFGVNAIAIDPNDSNYIYIGTGYNTFFYDLGYSSGLYKSVNGGYYWQHCNLIGFDINFDKAIVEVKINPKNPNTIYALSNRRLYRSHDRGETWDTIFDIFKTNLWAYNNHGGIEYLGGFADIEIMQSDTNVIYVSTYLSGEYFEDYNNICNGQNIAQRSGADIYYTNDNGTTWHSIYGDMNKSTRSLWISLDVTPADTNKIYSAMNSVSYYINNKGECKVRVDSTIINGHGTNGEILRSRPSNTRLSINISWLSPAFEISPTDTNVMYFEGGYLGDNPAFRRRLVRYIYPSVNIDTCFFKYNNKVHADQREILVLRGSAPGTKGKDDWILLGNDGGVSASFDGGTQWYSLNGTGLAITQFYGIDVAKNSPNLIAGGTQDNSEFIYDNGNWIIPMHRLSGDCGDVIFNPKNDSVFWTHTWPGRPTLRKVKKTNIWKRDSNNSPDRNGLLIFPMEIIGNSLYAATDTIWRSHISSGLSFSFYSSIDTFGYEVRSMDICDSNPDIIYVAFNRVPWDTSAVGCKKILYRTLNGGNSWTDITNNLRQAEKYVPCYNPIGDIEINPDSPNEVWIAIGYYWANPYEAFPYNGNKRVFHSTDYGETWNDYSTGLTPFPVNKLVYDPMDGILYAATDVGVFYTIPSKYSSMGWKCFSNDMPVCIVTDLIIDYLSNRLVASTFGRGIWVSSRYCPHKHDTITHSGSVYPNLYYADEIYSTGVIQKGTTTYKASQEITLGPGFEASGDNGVVFHAYIGECVYPYYDTTAFRSNSGEHVASEISEARENMPKVYPNPTNNKICIDISSGEYYYELYDIYGNRILFGKLDGIVSLEGIVSGVYLLRVFNRQNSYMYKIIKLR